MLQTTVNQLTDYNKLERLRNITYDLLQKTQHSKTGICNKSQQLQSQAFVSLFANKIFVSDYIDINIDKTNIDNGRGATLSIGVNYADRNKFLRIHRFHYTVNQEPQVFKPHMEQILQVLPFDILPDYTSVVKLNNKIYQILDEKS